MNPYFVTTFPTLSSSNHPLFYVARMENSTAGDERRAQEVLELTDASESTSAKNDEGEDGDNDEDMEGTGEDDHGMDEDASSELSAGDDLIGDLEGVLDGDFDFAGSYACGQTLPQAPNPCLNIASMGLVGLPLKERDAREIIACSSRAPYGHGERTVVNADVRDTWEIEPAKIKFDNPAWPQYVQDLSVNVVCKALGVSQKAPRCELYKLLLYEVGSHFLPHTDTEKSTGMFATMIIILPSAYTGGQVHVSHSNQKQTFDFSSTSLSSTAVLAWYTDVKHEVKPVTSGYRLALSYNIIHTDIGIPRPTLPDTHKFVTDLRRILRKWREDFYENTPDDNMAAYLLAHHYSSKNLASGMSALKGSDTHKVAHLKPIAEEQGFLVCLANLEYMVSGVADADYDRQMWKRQRFDSNEDEDEDEFEPCMEEVLESSMTLKNLFDLQGNSLWGSHESHINDDSLVPREPFEDAEPDDKAYEGYTGNAAGTLDYWYRRTVLILVHESDAGHALFNTGGIHYALEALRGSEAEPTPPTENNKRLAALVVKYVSSRDKGTLTSMFNLALRWKNLELWFSVIYRSGANALQSTFVQKQLVKAWKTFGFINVVQNGYRHLLMRTTRLGTRLDFIQALPAYAAVHEREAVLQWCQKETDHAMTTYRLADVEDIPTLLSISQTRGIGYLKDVVLSKVTKGSGFFKFSLALVTAIDSNKQSIIGQLSSLEDINACLDSCLEAAAEQWGGTTPTKPVYNSHTRTNTFPSHTGIPLIIDFVKVCIATGRMQPCRILFHRVLKSEGEIKHKFQTIFIPMIKPLRELLNKEGVDVSSGPFHDLFHLLIGSYLQDVLGAKPRLIARTKLRKIGCGCADCENVDTFLFSTQSAELTLRLVKARRLHVESRLNTASDLLTYQVIHGSPYRLHITKTAETVEAGRWSARQTNARSFLKKVGEDDVLQKVMGTRWDDVRKAIQGTEPFKLAQVAPVRNPPHPQAAPRSRGAEQMTGQQPVVLGPVIDLTDDNP